MHVLLNQDHVVLCGVLKRYCNTAAVRASASPAIWWHFSGYVLLEIVKIWAKKGAKRRGDKRRREENL